MNTKKLITLLLAATIAIPTFAQFETNRKRSRYNHNDTERYYGLRLGLNIATISSDESAFNTDSRTGLAFGGVYGFQLANNTPLWLELGAMYSEKGGETRINGYKWTYRLSYLQVPCVVKYSFDVYDDLYIQPFIGGYLAVGIAGQTKDYEHEVSTSSYDSDLFNRFDGGLRLGCGVEYKMVYAEIGYDLGLANISHSDFHSAHTRSLFMNIGVNF